MRRAFSGYQIRLFLWATLLVTNNSFAQNKTDFELVEELQGKYLMDSARILMQQVIASCKNCSSGTKAKYAIRYAEILKFRGQMDSSLIYLGQAERIFEKKHDLDSLLLVKTRRMELFRSIFDKELSLSELKKARGYADQQRTAPDILAYYYNRRMALISYYFFEDSIEVSKSLARKILDMESRIKEKQIVAYTMNELAYIIENKEGNLKGHEHYVEALEYARKHDLKVAQIDISMNLARTFQRMGRNLDAINQLERALSMAQEIQYDRPQFFLHELLRDAYVGEKNFEKAFEHSVKVREFDVKMKHSENKTKMNELERKYNFQLKENELALKEREQTILYTILGATFVLLLVLIFFYGKLRRNQKELKERNEMVREAAHRNELLVKEIHHRVKNNLQMISSLLELQYRKVESEESKRIMIEGQNRVKSMALIHKKLYQNENLASISFEEYLKDLCASIHQIYASSEWELSHEIVANDLFFDIDTAIPLGLIVTELVSNAYKYVYDKDRKNTLRIVLEAKEAGSYVLKVQDGGTGLPKDFDMEQSDTLGLTLVKSLSRQLMGTFYFDRETNTFTVTFMDTEARKRID
ncbi:MAG: sensor histidine kinase [Bacteroidetes bacterium]|nr:MAG: sensor histidine kinase [Bacteroidota bacterium]